MAKQNVFLTGASGTIGSAILDLLISTDAFSVDCLLRRPESGEAIKRAGGCVVLGDMADDKLFRLLHAKKHYHYIVHTAQAHYGQYTAEEIHRLDLKAVANLESIRTEVTKLMVYTSGVWIFGHQEGSILINESTPLRPFDAAKFRAHLVTKLLQQTDHPWAQLCPPSFVYGSVGPLIAIARGMKTAPVEVIDDESIQWSVIERNDLARAYLSLLQFGGSGEFYVVAEDDPVRVVDFYESVARYVPGSRTVRKSYEHFANLMPAHSLETKFASQPVDSTLLKQKTGWRARESFMASVSRFLPAVQY